MPWTIKSELIRSNIPKLEKREKKKVFKTKKLLEKVNCVLVKKKCLLSGALFSFIIVRALYYIY